MFLQEHCINSVYYLKICNIAFLFFTEHSYYNQHFFGLLRLVLLPNNHSQYLHRCTFISVFYSWKAFHFSL